MTKHEEIIKYILSLKTGTKISVRRIASALNVSEGTAYRAIKDCENMGNVTTIPRVGTVKIEKIKKKSIETLTFAEIINIVDGTILGGRDGIYKTLSKFVIGAMTIEAMKKYISPGCLLIIGNREEAQRLALENDSAVLITGGFECSDDIKKLADEKNFPVISSSFDSFTIASMINKAISESRIKKDIILVEDIMHRFPHYLMDYDTILMWKKAVQRTRLERYPVVNKDMKVVGIVTYKDVPVDIDNDEPISKFMIKQPIVFSPETTASYAAHVMGWEDIETCPVVKEKKLIGVVTRQDVIKALQYAMRQPQVCETVEDLIFSNFSNEKIGDTLHFYGRIVPEMLDSAGTASWSSLNMLVTSVGLMCIRQKSNTNVYVDSIFTYFMRPVQLDSVIHIYAKVIAIGRNFCKVEIEVQSSSKKLVSKAIMSAKLLRK